MSLGARFWAWVCACFLLFFAKHAFADVPIIESGREAEVVALVKPYFGAPISPGFSLENIDIQPHEIRLVIKGPSGTSTVTLEHPSGAPADAERSASFAIVRERGADAETAAAMALLVTAVKANDKGGFWPAASSKPGLSKTDPMASRFATGRESPIAKYLRNPDGVVLFFAALALVLVHLRRTLRGEPRHVGWALAGLVVIGACLRLAISKEVAMNVWSYERVVPLARSAYDGVVLPWVSRAFALRFRLAELSFRASFAIAVFTPLAFFAHARYLLRDTRGALFATALLVVLPNHIRFSRADSEFIQSLATSSLTFVLLYTALRDRSRGWRAFSFALLPVFSLATYFVRPENMFFWLIDVGAILLTSGEEAPRRRKALALVEITTAAGFAFVVHLLARFSGALREGLSLRTVFSAVTLFFHPRLNTLINPTITPPGLVLLAIAGAVFLYRRGERARSVFLTAWLLGFFVVHSVVRPSQEAMQARYHLHLITPLLFLAASALPDVIKWPRRVVVGGAVYFALSPIFHLRFERDTAFNDMREYAFLQEASRTIPDGCTVLEYAPAVTLDDPSLLLASRLDRMAVRLEHGASERAFRVVNFGTLAPGSTAETVSTEVSALAKSTPKCLRVYLGLTCRSHRPPGAQVAPVCEEMRRMFDLRPIAAAQFPSRIYDEAIAGRWSGSGPSAAMQPQLTEGEPIDLVLYEAMSK